MITVFAYTEKGPLKSENEDRLIIGKNILSEGWFSCECDGGIIAVADGVGGNNAGAVASQYVAERIAGCDSVSAEDLEEINRGLLDVSEANESLKGMATTLSAVAVSEDAAHILHVGNTRVWSLSSRGYLSQLTVDDTTLQYLLSTNRLSSENAAEFDKKNEIIACMGGGNPGLCKIKVAECHLPGKALILTSDGIHDYLSVDFIEEVFADHQYEDAIRNISAAARENGSQDDISIAVISI